MVFHHRRHGGDLTRGELLAYVGLMIIFAGFAVFFFFWTPGASAQFTPVNQPYGQYDNTVAYASRTGQLSSGTFIGPHFHKLATCPLDGNIYGQPIYLTGVTINGITQNALFANTQNGTIYAFNVDGASCTTLWSTHLSAPLYMGCQPPPVYDPSGGYIYTECDSPSNGGEYVIYKLSPSNGSVAASFVEAFTTSGSGDQNTSNTGNVTGAYFIPPVTDPGSGTFPFFGPHSQVDSSALLISSGELMTSYGGGSADQHPFHGYVVAHSLTDLSISWSWCSSPNGYGGGVWWVKGRAADGSGNIYLSTGNGDNTNGDLGDSIVELNSSGALVGAWTPSNSTYLEANDLDLSPGGTMILPATGGNYIAAAGKEGRLVTMPISCFAASTCTPSASFQSGTGGIRSMGYGNGFVYAGAGTTIYALPWNTTSGTLTTTPSYTVTVAGWTGRSAALTVQVNGAITTVWGVAGIGTTGYLYAWNGSLSQLYTSGTGVDALGIYNKYSVPLLLGTNGRVVVANADNQLVIYGNTSLARLMP